jgi:hypothetical protein
MSENLVCFAYRDLLKITLTVPQDSSPIFMTSSAIINFCKNKIHQLLHNCLLQELHGQEDLVAFIEKGRLRRLGYVEKLDDYIEFQSECCMVDKEEERETSVEVVRRCGGGLETDRSEEMED